MNTYRLWIEGRNLGNVYSHLATIAKVIEFLGVEFADDQSPLVVVRIETHYGPVEGFVGWAEAVEAGILGWAPFEAVAEVA
jgi:hypothetical protein